MGLETAVVSRKEGQGGRREKGTREQRPKGSEGSASSGRGVGGARSGEQGEAAGRDMEPDPLRPCTLFRDFYSE